MSAEVAVPAALVPSLQAGQFACLRGANGSGKSTLLMQLAGYHSGPRRAGLAASGRVAVVQQNPDVQILADTVADDIALALRHHRLPEDRIRQRVQSAMATVGLDVSPDCRVDALSMGQKQRLVLASVLATEPDVLLLDEPLAQLDADGRARLLAALATFRDNGGTVLLAEQDHVALPSSLVDCWYRVPSAATAASTRLLPLPDGPWRGVGVSLRQLQIGWAQNRPLLRIDDWALEPGDAVLLCGSNGCGKSSLLRCLAGGLEPLAGQVRYWLPGADRSVQPRVGLLLQNPEAHLFGRTVDEELRLLGATVEPDALIRWLGLAQFSRRQPMHLSFGQRHRLALGGMLATAPPLLLLDEPFAGVDPEQRQRLLGLLRLVNQAGVTLLLATHDTDLPGWWGETVTLRNGRLQ